MQWPRIDIVNENNELIGESKDYSTIHEKGLLHRAVVVWFVTDENKIILQKRSDEVKYPLKYTESVSGHVDSGEEPKQAAVRECLEELGIKISEEGLGEEHIAYFDEEVIPNWYESEFRYIYFVRISDERIINTNEEVEGIKLIPISEIIEYYNSNRRDFVPSKDEFFYMCFDIIKSKFLN